MSNIEIIEALKAGQTAKVITRLEEVEAAYWAHIEAMEALYKSGAPTWHTEAEPNELPF